MDGDGGVTGAGTVIVVGVCMYGCAVLVLMVMVMLLLVLMIAVMVLLLVLMFICGGVGITDSGGSSAVNIDVGVSGGSGDT